MCCFSYKKSYLTFETRGTPLGEPAAIGTARSHTRSEGSTSDPYAVTMGTHSKDIQFGLFFCSEVCFYCPTSLLKCFRTVYLLFFCKCNRGPKPAHFLSFSTLDILVRSFQWVQVRVCGQSPDGRNPPCACQLGRWPDFAPSGGEGTNLDAASGFFPTLEQMLERQLVALRF